MTRAFITGATGQDGTYLTRHLHAQGYEVHGLVRPGDQPPMEPELITVHSGDLTDRPAMTGLLDEIRPSQIYTSVASAQSSSAGPSRFSRRRSTAPPQSS